MHLNQICMQHSQGRFSQLSAHIHNNFMKAEVQKQN